MSELGLQLTLMVCEASFASAVLLGLFRARRIIGLAALYTTVGVFYFLATLLAGSVFVQVTPTLLMSPGSVALFPASLFAMLLVYIREDANEARSMIYGLLAANIAASLLGVIIGQHFRSPLAVNPVAVPPELFVQSPRLFVVGVLALFADTVLIILAYEAVSRVMRTLFLRIWITLTLVLTFDTLLFVTGGFVEHPAYAEILLSGVAGKAVAVIVYATALTLYLRRMTAIEPQTIDGGMRPALGNLFQVLTYRQKYEALRAQVTRDSLTGIHNRGFFDEMLRKQLAITRRNGTPVTVVIVDVDHFKRINDVHGHAEGDRALRAISQALVEAVRTSDLVCRYGGEEFCLILPGTQLQAAVPLAGRIRAGVPKACAGASIAGSERITVTIGLATAPEDGIEPDLLMRVADARLYRGKTLGRDRVVAA